jgi:hypothetical protein
MESQHQQLNEAQEKLQQTPKAQIGPASPPPELPAAEG